jgi:hypothetical protein
MTVKLNAISSLRCMPEVGKRSADIFAFGPVTNVALNPFRALAPAVLQVLFGGTYNLAHLVVYFVGPVVGGILGVLVYDFMTRGRAVVGSAELGGVSESAVEHHN